MTSARAESPQSDSPGWSEHRERRPGRRVLGFFWRPEGTEQNIHSRPVSLPYRADRFFLEGPFTWGLRAGRFTPGCHLTGFHPAKRPNSYGRSIGHVLTMSNMCPARTTSNSRCTMGAGFGRRTPPFRARARLRNAINAPRPAQSMNVVLDKSISMVVCPLRSARIFLPTRSLFTAVNSANPPTALGICDLLDRDCVGSTSRSAYRSRGGRILHPWRAASAGLRQPQSVVAMLSAPSDRRCTVILE